MGLADNDSKKNALHEMGISKPNIEMQCVGNEKNGERL